MSDGDAQIRLIEAVLNVPAKGTKLFALLNQGMKEAQAKQQLLKVLVVEEREKQKKRMVHKTNIPDIDMDQIVTILYFMFYELRLT